MSYQQRIRSDTNSPNNLITTIKNKRWDLVKFHLHEAKFPDEEDNYALHYLCAGHETPTDVLLMVHNAFPQAVYFTDSDGDTPLLNAVHSQFIVAVHYLSHNHPETVLIGNSASGSTPLERAIDFYEPNYIIDCLLFANPYAAHALNENPFTIFESFFKERNCSLRVFLGQHSGFTLSNAALDYKIISDETAWSARNVYLKSSLLLKATSMQNFNKKTAMDDSWLILHSAFKVDECPWSFCSFFLRLHPEQIMMTDSDGNLPIHIIAAASKDVSDEYCLTCENCGPVKEIYYLESKSSDAAFDSNRFCLECYNSKSFKENCTVNTLKPGALQITINIPLFVFHWHHILMKRLLKTVLRVPRIIQDLLSLTPTMTNIPDRSGNYPLQISILNEQSFNGTKYIFDACPWVGREKNVRDGLVSFKLAAVGDWENDMDQINTILYLLLQDPIVISY